MPTSRFVLQVTAFCHITLAPVGGGDNIPFIRDITWHADMALSARMVSAALFIVGMFQSEIIKLKPPAWFIPMPSSSSISLNPVSFARLHGRVIHNQNLGFIAINCSNTEYCSIFGITWLRSICATYIDVFARHAEQYRFLLVPAPAWYIATFQRRLPSRQFALATE